MVTLRRKPERDDGEFTASENAEYFRGIREDIASNKDNKESDMTSNPIENEAQREFGTGPNGTFPADQGDNQYQMLPRTEPGTFFSADTKRVPTVEELTRRAQAEQPMTIIQETHIVDLKHLANAQAAFLEAQTAFLHARRESTEQWNEMLARYSHAQTELIRAQGLALKQAGVL